MCTESQANAWHINLELFSQHFDKIHSDIVNYTKEIVEHFILFSLCYGALSVFLYILYVKYRVLNFNKGLKNPKRVLLVIAHPDDETMFFGPTLVNLIHKQKNVTVYLMCLSTGRNYGMGPTRKKELYAACKVLGIEESCIMIHNHTDLPDDIKVKWPAEIVGNLIIQQIERYNIDTLITFDRHGISSHPNHCSIYYAVALLSINKKLPKDCTVYVLESVNIIRKYWFIFDIIFSVLSKNRYIIGPRDRNLIYEAMTQHKSQFVWFRRIYIRISRYVFMNTLQEMSVSDIELDLDTDSDIDNSIEEEKGH